MNRNHPGFYRLLKYLLLFVKMVMKVVGVLNHHHHHHLHCVGPLACSGSIFNRKTFLFSVLWFTVELSSNKNVLQKRYQRLVE
jgi:hypothetical protein